MRRALALVFLLGLALAASCEGAPYTLKTPLGTLFGQALRYREGTLTFNDACLLAEGLRFQSPEIRYQKAGGRLSAKNPAGEVRGYRFSAEALSAQGDRAVLVRVRLVRGPVVVVAARAVVAGEAVELERLSAKTARYRFSAERGRLSEGRFVAEGVRGTPCQSGDALALAGRRAVFDAGTGRLLLEESEVRYYGVCLARPARLLLDTRKPPRLALPLRFSIDQGASLGVERLPLPEPGVPLGEERAFLTLLAEHLGTPRAGLAFGLAQKDAGFLLGVGPARFSLSLWAPGVRSERRDDGNAYLALAPGFDLGPLRLSPTAVAANARLAYGVSARARLRWQGGGFSLSLSPWFLGLLHPDAPAFAGVGGRLAASVAGVRLAYARSHRLAAPATFWEAEQVAEREDASLAYGPLALAWTRDLAAGWARAGVGYRGALSLEVKKGFGSAANRLELVAGYRAGDPAPGGFALAPSLGYDFGLGRVSRFALDLAYADGCFVYRLRAAAALAPWPGETAGARFSLGLSLR